MTLRPLGVAPEKCMIGGRWISPANNESLSLINPSDGSVLCDIAKGSKEDIDQAVFAAESALRGIWVRMNWQLWKRRMLENLTNRQELMY